MKPIEIFDYVEQFDKMFKDERFTLEARVQMGRELLNSLPPASLIRSSSHTYMATHNYISAMLQGAINAAERNTQQDQQSTESQTTKESSLDTGQHAHASNQTDESGRRREMGTPSGAPKKNRRKK